MQTIRMPIYEINLMFSFYSINIQISYSQIDIVTYVKSCYKLTPRLTECKHFLLLYALWVFTIETWRVSIADSCTFHLNSTCRNATNHCPRASFPLIHGSRGLQRHYSPLKDIVCKIRYIVANVLWRNGQTISISIKYAPL